MVAAVGLGLAIAPTASADTSYTVNTTSDTNAVNPAVSPVDSSGNMSLRSVIEYLNTTPPSGGATINLPSGNYTLTAEGGAGQGTDGALSLSTDGPVTIAGSLASSPVIDANFLDRAMEIWSGTVTISGVTIEHGRTGGDLQGDSATTCPTSPTAPLSPGGAILDEGILTLADDTFTDNMSEGSGGAIEDQGGPLTVLELSKFTGNSACRAFQPAFSGAGDGGAIDESRGATVTIDSSTISGNLAQGDGGGLAEDAVSDPTETVTYTTISNNHATDGGGVVGEGNGSILLYGDTLTGNTATGGGGAIGGNDADQVVNTTITGNSAGTGGTGDGGGIENAGGPVTISFSTINDNNALGGSGGNLANDDSATFPLDDSIVTGGIADSSAENCSGQGFTSNGHNLFDDNGTACGAPATGDLTNSNAHLGPLTQNGGSTRTEALRNGSPAVDAASSSLCHTEPVSPTATPPGPRDQRGFSRPQGAGCDIGAFETTPDLGVRGSVSKDVILAGQQDTITWTVGNSNSSGAANTTFSDPGAGFKIDSVTPSQGSCTHTTTSVTCHLGLVSPGAHVTIKVVVTGLTPGKLTLNGATATTNADLNPANDHATVTLTVKKKKPPPPPPPPHHHHKPPRPTITVLRLARGCYAPGTTITVKARAIAKAGIKRLSLTVSGHGFGQGEGAALGKGPVVHRQTFGIKVAGSRLLAGRTYRVVATVTDKLGRTDRDNSQFTICNSHTGQGFTG
jgi:hypothetical protein